MTFRYQEMVVDADRVCSRFLIRRQFDDIVAVEQAGRGESADSQYGFAVQQRTSGLQMQQAIGKFDTACRILPSAEQRAQHKETRVVRPVGEPDDHFAAGHQNVAAIDIPLRKLEERPVGL